MGQKMDDEASILMRRSQSCRRMAERMDDPEAGADLLRLADEYESRANAWFEADGLESKQQDTALFLSQRSSAGSRDR